MVYIFTELCIRFEEETKMKKERYELLEMEIIKFTTEDVVMTSPLEEEEDETPLNPPKN